MKMKIWIFLAVLLSPAMSYGQEVCVKEIQLELSKYESNKLRGRLNRSLFSSNIRIIEPLNSHDPRWEPFGRIQILDLDADGDYEIVGRYDESAYGNYRARFVVLNSFPTQKLEEIIDLGDVAPGKFVDDDKLLNKSYLYSDNNSHELIPYRFLDSLLLNYTVSYKDLVNLNGRYYMVVAFSGEQKHNTRYFVFTLSNVVYSDYCEFKF
ncbi:hypothetical protein [Rheinheimera sp.]|uniref:hypothetical protein n=1 Tax=Rheinheimera sp. TaxID=1869214 RepID=UPI003D297A2B